MKLTIVLYVCETSLMKKKTTFKVTQTQAITNLTNTHTKYICNHSQFFPFFLPMEIHPIDLTNINFYPFL